MNNPNNPNNPVNPNNDYMCHIRRAGPQGWTRSRPHHQEALLRFLDMPPTNDPVRIAVPHTDGGDFVAFFRRLNAAVCQYTDENGNVVDIMMSSPSHAAFINRVVDHY
jgi:hypothetical protein